MYFPGVEYIVCLRTCTRVRVLACKPVCALCCRYIVVQVLYFPVGVHSNSVHGVLFKML